MIDDVWTIAAWDAIFSSLPENKNSSRIIVTTRIETVAKACSGSVCQDYYIYPIKPLSHEDSKKLFLYRAFGSKDPSCPPELEDDMLRILRKCGGLPLAIVSIASLLAGYRSPECKGMWGRVCSSLGSHIESHPTLEGMRQILTLSYSHLPYDLKCCMMYFSIFPEDNVIEKGRLLNRWIAEGLVAEKRGLTLLEVAEGYYDELMSRGMIDRADDNVGHIDGRVETCRVHDMMLEVMVSKSLEANFVSLVGRQYQGMSYDRIRRISIHGVEEGSKDSLPKKKAATRGMRNGIKGANVQHIRSLSSFQQEGHMLLDRLGELNLVRVLDLEDCNGLENKHMRHICRMHLLKYLGLKGTNISVMPPQVGDLEHLLTLDHGGAFRWKLPRGFGKMKALRKVNKAVITNDIDVAREIGELEQLQEFVRMFSKHLPISLGKLHSLRWFNTGDLEYGHHAMNFLHQIPSPPRLLEYLRISGSIDRLPDWVGQLANLVDFSLGWTFLDGDQLFGVLWKLPNLKNVTVEAGCYAGEELVARTSHKFPVIRDLRLTSYNYGDAEVYRFEEGSMPTLEKLTVVFPDGMERAIAGIEYLTSLKEVNVSGSRDNRALECGLEEMKKENERRPKSSQFKVVAIW
ncbi:hypothetical protein VPH35_118524 [Triticum aestivum]